MTTKEKCSIEFIALEYKEYKRIELDISNMKDYVNEVLDYLMNAEEFGKYKDTKNELSTYSYFVELATKIPAFPLNIRSSEEIKSVGEFLSEQLDGKDVTYLIGVLDNKFLLTLYLS